MNQADVVKLRLRNHYITAGKFSKPEEVVEHFVAVQAQDYPGALWGISQRLKKPIATTIEKSLTSRAIVRTWPMRGTLHLVLAQDIRWLLSLLTPRIVSRASTMYRQCGLTDDIFDKAKKVIINALQNEKQLTRDAFYKHLENAGIATTQQRGLHIIGYLAQQQVICFGEKQGAQHTFVLLDEWVPKSKILSEDEALRELALRYFKSHGPATLKDFSWWSGLAPSMSRKAIELSQDGLIRDVIEKVTYWNGPATRKSKPMEVALLPSYDEYTVAYSDRSAILDPKHAAASRNGIFSPVVVVNGQIAGIWRRTISKQKVDMEAKCYKKLNSVQVNQLKDQMEVYARFLELPLGTAKIKQTPKAK